MRIIGPINEQFICPCGKLVYNGYRVEISPGSTGKRCEDCVKNTTSLHNERPYEVNQTIPPTVEPPRTEQRPIGRRIVPPQRNLNPFLIALFGLSVMIILILLWRSPPPASTDQPAVTTPGRYPEHIETLPVETLMDRYVHFYGLNAHIRPTVDSPVRFTLSQNALVKVSDRDKSGDWVKINYFNNEGYVNQTYLRDFRITELLVGDTLNGEWNVRPGSSLNGRSIHFLGTQVRISTLNSYNTEIKFRIRIFSPNGNLFYSLNSFPHSYTYEVSRRIRGSGTYNLNAWGTDSGGAYYRGSWRVEIWYENPSNPGNTNACIASQIFSFE
jgi:hypothetical protein